MADVYINISCYSCKALYTIRQESQQPKASKCPFCGFIMMPDSRATPSVPDGSSEYDNILLLDDSDVPPADEVIPTSPDASPAPEQPVPSAQTQQTATAPKVSAPPKSNKAYWAALLLFVTVLSLSVCVGIGVGAYNWWNTPTRALQHLISYVEVGDMPSARPLVAPTAWATDDAYIPDDLKALLQEQNLKEDSFAWTYEDDSIARYVWAQSIPISELQIEKTITLENKEHAWQVTAYSTGWGADVLEAGAVLAQMRKAADAHSGEQFLQPVKPGKDTCTSKTCKDVVDAIERGLPTSILDTINMKDMVPGSLKVIQDGDELIMRWLRKTTYLDQEGIIEVRFKKENGQWFVTSSNSSHFDALNDEMETWTENHGEMLWRQKLSSLVAVKSLNSYCADWFYGVCILQILPTQVTNVGTQTIREVKVSKVRSARYVGNASQTLWGVFRNIAPGKNTSTPSSFSPPVRGGTIKLSETWEFYRVEWMELEDGTRYTYSHTDYRNAAGGTLKFDEVLAAREQGGMSMKSYEKLREQLILYGFQPPVASDALPIPTPQP